MAIQKISGGIIYPNIIPLSNPTSATLAFTSSVKQYACNFRVPKTGTIAGMGFSIASNAFSSNPFTIGLQSVNSTGWPSGTYIAGGNAYGSFIAYNTFNLPTYFEVGFNTRPAVNQGDLLSIVWTAPTTFSTPVGLGYLKTSASNSVIGEPTMLSYSSSTWGIASMNGFPSFTLVYDDLTYANIPFVYPYNNTGLAAGSYTNLKQIGMKFSLPFIASVCGAVIDKETFSGNAGSAEVVLYDSDGIYANALAKNNVGYLENNGALIINFPNDVILQPNVQYRIALRQSSNAIPALPTMYQWAPNITPSITGSNNFMMSYTNVSQPLGLYNDWLDRPLQTTFISLMINGLDDDTGNNVSNIGSFNYPVASNIQ